MKHTENGLYDQAFEHDACGIGAVISIKGEKSHRIVDDALKIVEKLEHRAGKDATGEVGDGVGINCLRSSRRKRAFPSLSGERFR